MLLVGRVGLPQTCHTPLCAGRRIIPALQHGGIEF
jgi:hypothetical protein